MFVNVYCDFIVMLMGLVLK